VQAIGGGFRTHSPIQRHNGASEADKGVRIRNRVVLSIRERGGFFSFKIRDPKKRVLAVPAQKGRAGYILALDARAATFGRLLRDEDGTVGCDRGEIGTRTVTNNAQGHACRASHALPRRCR
jgi:hypothetical protein